MCASAAVAVQAALEGSGALPGHRWRRHTHSNASLLHAQGFAPHFDDVDVYVLQTEGRKRWRVYAPLAGHALPRYSSRDFVDAEIGSSLLDVVLEPGDLLYLPRGTIHQAESRPDGPSLHLTVSADHRRSWADFLEATLQVRPSSPPPRRSHRAW